MKMNESQLRAEMASRAEEACTLLRNGHDTLHEIMEPLSFARRSYNSIVMGNNNSVEVVRDLMSELTTAGDLLDEMLMEIWQVMNPDEKGEGDADFLLKDPGGEEGVDSVRGEGFTLYEVEQRAIQMYNAVRTPKAFAWENLKEGVQEYWRQRAYAELRDGVSTMPQVMSE